MARDEGHLVGGDGESDELVVRLDEAAHRTAELGVDHMDGVAALAQQPPARTGHLDAAAGEERLDLERLGVAVTVSKPIQNTDDTIQRFSTGGLRPRTS